jgi:hypothetical protein
VIRRRKKYPKNDIMLPMPKIVMWQRDYKFIIGWLRDYVLARDLGMDLKEFE